MDSSDQPGVQVHPQNEFRVEHPLRARVDSERRKYTRIATDQVVSFAAFAGDCRLATGQDVSKGGIRFEAVGCEINFGDVLNITFNLAERTIAAVGRVSWATEIDAIRTDVGVRFLKVDASASRALKALGADIEAGLSLRGLRGTL